MAEERLCEKAIFGRKRARGSRGFFFPTNRVDKSSYKSKRRIIQNEVCKGEDEIKLTKMVVLKQPGAWTNWNSTTQRKIKWCEILNDYANVRFLIRSVYDILPSRANLCIWNKTESALCPLCSGQETLRHILSSCPKALAKERYRWHDQILSAQASVRINWIQRIKWYSLSRHPCCNGYRRKKWTRRHEFKSWIRLIAFHIALVLLQKVWIQLFSLQLWVNSRAD